MNVLLMYFELGAVLLCKLCFCFLRQHKLEEALLFSGRFTDALQALNDWLFRAEPQLAEDVPVGGEKDLVNNLIDKHKVPPHLSHNSLCYAEESPQALFTLLHFICVRCVTSVYPRCSRKSWGSGPDVYAP